MRPFWKKPPEAPAPVVLSAEEKERIKYRHWMSAAWSSGGIQLWLTADDDSAYLCFLQIKQLSICHEGKEISRWICGYCGTPDQEGGSCSACGGPRRGRRQEMALILIGPLPHALVLNGRSSPFVLEMHYVECGRQDTYAPERLVARMSDCEIISQRVTGLGDPGEYRCKEQGLYMEYAVKCQIVFTVKELIDLDYYRN